MAPSQRRLQRDSEMNQEGFMADNPISIEAWNSGKDPYRVSAGGLPVTWPYKSTWASTGSDIHKTATRLQSQYSTTLSKNKIECPSAPAFLSMWQKGFEGKARQVMRIQTKGVDTTSWKSAAKEISELFVAAGTRDMMVEIQNPDLMYRDRTLHLPRDSQIQQAMKQVQAPIYALVKQNLSGLWTSIGFEIRGPDDSNIRKPTVVITVRPESVAAFSRIENLIATAASTNDPQVSLHVEFLPALIELSKIRAPQIVFKDPGQLPIPPGNASSISSNCDAQAAPGSLGGFVHFTPSDAPDTNIKCILTCYNAITENKPEHDKNGIGLKGAEPADIQVMYPANLDTSVSENFARNLLDGNPNAQGPKIMLDLLKQRANDPIGKVLFASGLQTANRGASNPKATNTGDKPTLPLCRRLDWALIEVSRPELFGNNFPPPSSAFNLSSQTLDGKIAYSPHPTQQILEFGQYTDNQWVARSGRTSTMTGQIMSSLGLIVSGELEDLPDSCEDVVFGLGTNKDFALAGDMGSWVLSAELEMVGLCGGGQVGKDSVVVVTPVGVVREDIREVCGGDISLP